jgi:hypothetical protein
MATSSLESWSHSVAGMATAGLSEELEEPQQWQQSDELWRQTHSGWEEVTIAEEAEDGEAMEEKVWLPSAASTSLMVLFFSLAVELQRNSVHHSDMMNQKVIAAQLGQTAQRRVVSIYNSICSGVASACGEAAVLQVRSLSLHSLPDKTRRALSAVGCSFATAVVRCIHFSNDTRERFDHLQDVQPDTRKFGGQIGPRRLGAVRAAPALSRAAVRLSVLVASGQFGRAARGCRGSEALAGSECRS